jgi:hypothetical protein
LGILEEKGGIGMIKGISKQVIVVNPGDKKLFEQAIFILRNDAVEQGVTDEMLLQEARQAVRGGQSGKKRHMVCYRAFWSAIGAAVTGMVWLVSSLL